MILLLLLALQDGAQVFLTEEEAVKIIFPNGEKVTRKEITLDNGTKEAVESRLKRQVEEKHLLFVGFKDGKAVGYAIVTEEITKTLPATFIVGVSLEGQVTDVAVMVHREKIGADCAKRRFLDQLRGKTLADPIRKNKDVVHVTSATMSCDAVMRGTRKVLAIVKEWCLERPSNVSALLQEEPATQKRYVMGAMCTITAYGPKAKEGIDKAFDEIKRLDALLSNYKDDSELSRARKGPVKLNPDTLTFLKECAKYVELTGGAFDPTIGPVVALWGFKDGKYRVPSEDELRAAMKRVGWSKVKIDDGTLTLAEGMEIDPGAIGKGFAVDFAAAALKKEGVTCALVDFGSSIYALGAPPGKEGWTVAIKDPFKEGAYLGKLVLKDESVSTSGDYEKMFVHEGKRYTHVFDARTGRPIEGVAQVTVIAPTGTASDALSTSVFIGGVDLGSKAGVEAILVPSDPKAAPATTKGWKARLK